jgi:hypothetical protein
MTGRDYVFLIGLILLGISSKLKSRGTSDVLWQISDIVLEPAGYAMLGSRVVKSKEDKGVPAVVPPAPSSITVNMPSAPATAPPTP